MVRLFYANKRRWNDTARKAGISDGLLRYWLAGEDINPDKEYAGELRSRLKVKPRSRHVLKDPFPYGVEMASIRKHAESVMWFIPVYNNLRKKDSLGHMTPFAFREANPQGTYLLLL